MTHAQLRIVGDHGPPVYKWLHHGRDGNAQTLEAMAQLVRHAVEMDTGLQDFAHKILQAAGARGDVRTLTDREYIAIFNFVRYSSATKHGVVFRRDPAGSGDSVEGARVTLKRGYGDCDAISVLLAALLGCVGYVCRFVVIRVNPATVSGFNHVYVEVKGRRGWVALDATKEDAAPGWAVEKGVIVRATYRIFEHDSETPAGLSGFFSALANIGLQVGGALAAPFTGGASVAAAQAAAGMLAQHSAGKAQEREFNNQFDSLAKQATNRFNSILSKRDPITTADVQEAEQLYAQLAQIGEQAPTKAIREWWSSPNYGEAYRAQLETIRAAAPRPRPSAQGGGAAGSAAGFDSKTLLVAGGALAAGWFLFGRSD